MSARWAIAAAIATLTALALSGCTGTPATTGVARQADSALFTDGWAKAAAGNGMGMSALFGTLTNTGSVDVNLVRAECAGVATSAELHETAADASGSMKMRPKSGGFMIPAGGQLALAPGGNHIMLMGLTAPLEAGSDVSCVLTFADDSTIDVSVPVKEFSGANESYTGSTATPTPMTMG